MGDSIYYDNINRLLKDISEDLDMPPDLVERIYIGSGEDMPNMIINGRYINWVQST